MQQPTNLSSTRASMSPPLSSDSIFSEFSKESLQQDLVVPVSGRWLLFEGGLGATRQLLKHA
jgi:hypothetical protein